MCGHNNGRPPCPRTGRLGKTPRKRNGSPVCRSTRLNAGMGYVSLCVPSKNYYASQFCELRSSMPSSARHGGLAILRARCILQLYYVHRRKADSPFYPHSVACLLIPSSHNASRASSLEPRTSSLASAVWYSAISVCHRCVRLSLCLAAFGTTQLLQTCSTIYSSPVDVRIRSLPSKKTPIKSQQFTTSI